MTYTIPPDSPKAVKAAAFGRELVEACRRRGVPLKELERATGVGHTSIDNYRRGLSLPKVEVAKALAAALDWPRLATMIVAARTFPCARSGCERTFRNDTGVPRRYCSSACQAINANVANARRRLAKGSYGLKRPRTTSRLIEQVYVDPWTGQMLALPLGDDPRRAAYRKGMAIADERARLLEDAVAAMCAACEPEGVCRTPDCPLRAFSPLPLEIHQQMAPARTIERIRAAAAVKATPTRRASMRRRWADPAWRAAQETAIRAGNHPARDPERREAWLDNLTAAKAGGGARRKSPGRHAA